MMPRKTKGMDSTTTLIESVRKSRAMFGSWSAVDEGANTRVAKTAAVRAMPTPMPIMPRRRLFVALALA